MMKVASSAGAMTRVQEPAVPSRTARSIAGPPPARPLGPHALADMARGVAPQAAAAREERTPPPASATGPAGPVAESDAPVAESAAEPTRRPRKRRGQPAAPVVRRARDRQSAPAARAPAALLPLLDELRLSEGRAVLERLLRQLGARPKAITAALATGWRRPDGTPPLSGDLA